MHTSGVNQRGGGEGERGGSSEFRILDDDIDPERSPSMRLLRSASKRIDCCLASFSGLSYAGRVARFLAAELERRQQQSPSEPQLHVRVIMPITPENMGASKMLLRSAAGLYHSAGLELGGSSFAIVDGSAYVCHVGTANTLQGDVHRLLSATSPSFVEMQQYLFDSLLERAVPAKEKIRELARGAGESNNKEFAMTIRNPRSVLSISQELVSSAAYEVLVLFSSLDFFFEAEEQGLLDLLGEASGRGVAVRVLVKVGDDAMMKDASKQKIKQKHDRINVAFIRPQPGRGEDISALIIADQAYSFTVEPEKGGESGAPRQGPSRTTVATYSNGESAVLTYCSMFENLWIQAELERQNSIKQAYFQMFKGQKLKDEVYRRDWRLKEKEEEKNENDPAS